MSVNQIVVSFADGEGHALGSCWSFRTKKNDFYIEPLGHSKRNVIHLSLHGPWPGKPDHRFHLKLDDAKAARKRADGQLVEHGIPANGQRLNGVKVAHNAFLVCRLRWMANLQQTEYLAAATAGVDLPELGPTMKGSVLNFKLLPASAWDLDVVISYDEPYWPHAERTETDNSRLGSLKNDAGMYLTVTSFHRTVETDPPPDGIVAAPPDRDETPNLLLCGGLDSRPAGEQDLYWFVETVTSRELLQRSFPNQFGM